MNFVAIIPAKKKSFRIPNKNLTKYKGKTLLENTIIQAKKSKLLDEIYISTDSQKIREISKKYGVSLLPLRSKKYSGKKASMHSVITHELKKIKKFFRYVVILQPTSPLRTSKDIDDACKLIYKNKTADSLVSCSELPKEYYPSKIMIKKKFHIDFFDLKAVFLNNLNIKKTIRLGKKFKSINLKNNNKLLFRNGAIYITKIVKIKEYIIGGKIISFLMPIERSLDINEKKDLINLRKF